MTGLKTQNRRPAAGDPLSDLLDDTSMKSAGARPRPRITYSSTANKSSVWWIAGAASIVWIAAVFAFSWARFSLPGDPRSALNAAQSRIPISDWLMIVAVIAGPVLLIWVIAWLVRRSMELRDESRKLAKAAILLADAAETAEKRAEKLLPAPDSMGGELIASGPGHLYREIERASHAMSALQSQMSTMETALAKQAAAYDDAAERTRSLNADAIGAGAVSAGLLSSGAVGQAKSTSVVEGDDPIELGADLVVEADEVSHDPSAVDLSLEPETDVERARRALLAAGDEVGWQKLVPDAPAAEVKAAATGDKVRDDLATLKVPPAPAEPATIDPFDDLGPSTPKAAVASTIAAGAAMGFGATRDDRDDTASTVSLGAPQVNEPQSPPVAVHPSAIDDPMPKREDIEFMAKALDWNKFVRAANFPESESDTATLDALYDVLTDPVAAALLQSSEDALATLADLDLYMEDFIPEMSPVMAWRAHLEGKSGQVQAIDAPIEQSRIHAKLASDGDFRKLSDRFIERYHVVLKRLFEEEADDRLALELADSRTGRAYLLIADALRKL